MAIPFIDDAKTGLRRATVAIALIFVLQCITLFVLVATTMHLSEKIDALDCAAITQPTT